MAVSKITQRHSEPFVGSPKVQRLCHNQLLFGGWRCCATWRVVIGGFVSHTQVGDVGGLLLSHMLLADV